MTSAILILLLTTSSFKYSQGRDFTFQGCSSYKDLCIPGNNAEVSIIKSSDSKFKRCPDTSKVCLESGSTIVLQDESGVYIHNYGRMKIEGNGMLNITKKGYCNIHDGKLFINRNGSVEIEAGYITIMGDGVLINDGMVQVENNANLLVWDKSFINVESSGKLQMKHNSDLKIYRLSSLHIGGPLCGNDTFRSNDTDTGKYTGEIILEENSKLFVEDHSSVDVQYGKIVINGTFRVDKYSSFEVNGLLEIAGDFSLNHKRHIVVGYRPIYAYPHENNMDHYCGRKDASLILFSNVYDLPPDLVVVFGAHCYGKIGVDSKALSIRLDVNTDTEKFKCFNSRDSLREAVSHLKV